MGILNLSEWFNYLNRCRDVSGWLLIYELMHMRTTKWAPSLSPNSAYTVNLWQSKTQSYRSTLFGSRNLVNWWIAQPIRALRCTLVKRTAPSTRAITHNTNKTISTLGTDTFDSAIIQPTLIRQRDQDLTQYHQNWEPHYTLRNPSKYSSEFAASKTTSTMRLNEHTGTSIFLSPYHSSLA
jgi:hypothetical protein